MGSLFFVRDGVLMSRPFNASGMKFTGDATPVAEHVAFNSRNGGASFSVGGNGTVIWQPSAEAQWLAWLDAAGRKLATVHGPETMLSRFAILPDGSRALVPVTDHRSGTNFLWMFGLDRESATRVTFTAAGEAFPVVTPDGSRVFFTSDAQSNLPDIYEAPLDGSTVPKPVVSATGNQLTHDISRYGPC